jgi:subtilisin family serine protease
MGVKLSQWLEENLPFMDDSQKIDLLRRGDLVALKIRPSQIHSLPSGNYTVNSEYRLQVEGSETEPYPEPTLFGRRRTITYVPSSDIVNLMVDRATEATGAGVRVGIIDTGLTLGGPQWRHTSPERHRVKGLTDRDWHGHGTHIASLVGGAPASTDYGLLTGIAPGVDIVSIKAFNPAGTSDTVSLLKAMRKAVELECDIVNISSGSQQMDDIDNMEEHKLIKDNQHIIFVCAAGNGGETWSISSPGSSPYALSIGSVSFNDGELSYFSAYGPSGEWYRERPDEYEEDSTKYGQDFHKPDFVAPGGGRAERGMRPIEVITSSGGGWYGAYYDGRRDGFMSAQGTSQSAPIVSGIIALLMEEGKVSTASDVRGYFNSKREGWGYGVPLLSKF